MLLAGASALILITAAGCGDDSGGGASNAIETTASEFQFDGNEWTVSAGEEFTMDFTNDGSVDHEWAVLTEEISSEAEFSEDIVLFEVEATPPGESVSQSFTVDDAGTYQVVCALEDHFDAGMEGTLTVE